MPISIPSRPAQSVLAYLALTVGTVHRRERVAGLLWPDAADESARAGLRQSLWRLRKALEGSLPSAVQYVLADDLTVAFNPKSPVWLDVAVLDQPGNREDELKASAEVYRSELLPGFYDDWVVRERDRLEAVFERKISALLDRLLAAETWPDVLEWAERWIAVGHVPEPAYRALMLAHSERGDRARVASVYQRCRQALFEELGVAPSEQTRALFNRLSQDYRLAPRLTLQFDSLEDRQSPLDEAPAPGEPPYQGLQFFDEPDAARFFGREAVVARLAQRLESERFLGVIGASGSGKSSVVRAGLLPVLKRPDSADGSLAIRRAHLLTPTAHPLAALAAALTTGADSSHAADALLKKLAQSPRSLSRYVLESTEHVRPGLLIVDQFEELFTLCHDAFEREAFVDHLLTVAVETGGCTRVVITLRADFYAHCAQYPDLRQALAEHQEYLGPMGPEELRQAIEGPAEHAGWVIEPGLVDLVIRDVGEEPGSLPLLSHALLETWRHRRGRILSIRGYTETGGVRGAIAKTAETVVHERLSLEERAIARRIFLRLTELGEGTQDTRRRVRISELIPGPEDSPAVRRVIQALADARLITLGADIAEVAHEALIREWPTLRAWLDDDRDGLRLHRHLTDAAADWQRLGGDPDMLYRGARLLRAAEWAAAHGCELNVPERAFLEAGQALAQAEVTEREAQRQRELQAAQRATQAERLRAEAEGRRAEEQSHAAALLRRRAVYLIGALVLALGMAGLALAFGGQAHQSAASAQTSAQAAFARELASAAVSNLDVDPERSILLALRSVSLASSGGAAALREAQEALHRAVGTSRVQRTLRGSSAGVFQVAFSPDGQRLAAIDQGGTARVWDADNGRELLSFGTDSSGNYAGTALAFNPDGSRLATICGDRSACIRDSTTGAELVRLAGHDGPTYSSVGGPVQELVYSADGSRLATGGTDGRVKVWDVVSGQLVLDIAANVEQVGMSTPIGPGGVMNALAFSPNGELLATSAAGDSTVRIWDLATGTQKQSLAGHRGSVLALGFSPEGTRLATGGEDTTVRIWDLGSGTTLTTLFGHASLITRVMFDAAGTRLLTASEDGRARIWEAVTGRELVTLAGHSSGVLGATFSPDGRQVATASRDATVRLWDTTLTGRGEWPTLVGHTDLVVGVSISGDNARIATASVDRTVRVWDAATGQSIHLFAGAADAVEKVAFSPDGQKLAGATADGTARVWDPTTGLEQLVVPGNATGEGNGGLVWSPDQQRLVASFGGPSASILEVATGRIVSTFSQANGIQDLAMSPDGTRLAAALTNGTASVSDLVSMAPLLTLDSQTTIVNGIAFSPDGRLVATGANDGLVRLWDARSGRALAVRSGHSGSVFGVSFSPDGRYLASASVDRTIKIWELEDDALSPEAPLTLYGHSAAVYSVAWSSDARRLVTGSRDRTSRDYAVAVDDLVAMARARVTRTFTVEECQKYLHASACPG